MAAYTGKVLVTCAAVIFLVAGALYLGPRAIEWLRKITRW